MGLREWEGRLGLRLDNLEDASPGEIAEIHRRLLASEPQLDESALALCEQLLPLLNVKNRREMAELIVRRWPDSPRAQVLRNAAAATRERRGATGGG